MSQETNIEWCDSTFNPWIGCTKVSPACDHCYAERDFDKRRHVVQWGPGQPRQRTTPANWKKPLQWNAKPFHECVGCGWRGETTSISHGLITEGYPSCPECDSVDIIDARRRVFCASLADVFDNEVDPQWRNDLFALIEATPNLDWLLLTKRIGNVFNMVKLIPGLPKNVWLGATICNQEEADRDIPKLLTINATVKFLSIEPLLGAIDLSAGYLPCPNAGNTTMDPSTGAYECCRQCDYSGLTGEFGIDWVIVGGESGPQARPMHPAWVTSLRDQCQAAGVPFLFKQWGEWGTAAFNASTGLPVFRQFPDHQTWVNKARTWVNGGICLDTDGKELRNGGDMARARDGGKFPVTIMHKVGKKEAGRYLDGETHTEFPKVGV